MAHQHLDTKKITRKQCLVMVLMCLTVGTVSFVLAYIGMKYGSFLGKLNQPVLSWMVEQRYQPAVTIAKMITALASPVILVPVATIAAIIWAYFKKDLWRPILLVSALAISSITSMLLKLVFMDSRPDQINMIPAFETDFSFPSGHTITAAVFLLAFGYLVYSRNFSSKKMIYWTTAALLGTIIIAVSRLYLGYHWLTDVIASLGLGLLVFAVIVLADINASKKIRNL